MLVGDVNKNENPIQIFLFIWFLPFLFFKHVDSPVKYVVKLFCSLTVKGTKVFTYIISTSHNYLVRGSAIVSLFCK